MAFNWKEFLELARVLEEQARQVAFSEGWLRTAVSRTYFGAYCHARNYAASFLGFEPRENADDHGRLRAHLRGKRRKGDADRLDSLRQWRNDADYLNELPWQPAPVVAQAIAAADAVFASLAPPV